MLKRLRNECLIELDLVTEGPLLIKSGKMFAKGAELSAVRTMRGGDWEVYIPGSSLKGTVRSQAERIARTLADGRTSPGCCDPFSDIDDASRLQGASCSSFLGKIKKDKGDDDLPATEVYKKSCPVCRIFGSLSQSGRLAFDDAHLKSPARLSDLPIRNNVAINRRTGGAAGGALFDMEVVPPTTRFGTSLYLRNFELWQLGLLAFVLRDMEEGLVKMGTAKSRGLGRIRAEVTEVQVRYLGLHPQPEQGSPCVLRGMKGLEPDAGYGFASYGNSANGQQAARSEAEGLPLYPGEAPADAVRAEPDDFGLRTVYRFSDGAQRRQLWKGVAPLWVSYARNHPYSLEGGR